LIAYRYLASGAQPVKLVYFKRADRRASALSTVVPDQWYVGFIVIHAIRRPCRQQDSKWRVHEEHTANGVAVTPKGQPDFCKKAIVSGIHESLKQLTVPSIGRFFGAFQHPVAKLYLIRLGLREGRLWVSEHSQDGQEDARGKEFTAFRI
jgi:hypothetical protein